ncbi:hypothetical protein C0993_012736 [Termitomyces sp. T159_Od127]|nr:hypothetical protein C0993_012736 [Termitomyces sp. T159_Od127]
MLIECLLSILASSLSIGKDLKPRSSNQPPPPSPDLQKEIDYYISSAGNTLVEVNALLAANVSVLSDDEFYTNAEQSKMLERELNDMQDQILEVISTECSSDKARKLRNQSLIKKGRSEQLRVTVSHVSAIAQKRAQALGMLKELMEVCNEDPTFQRRLDFLALSKEMVNMSTTLVTIWEELIPLASPNYKPDLSLSNEKSSLEKAHEISHEQGFPIVREEVKAEFQATAVEEGVAFTRLRPFSMP